jgi:hypothetical protein
MAEESRVPLREKIWIIVLSPFFIFLGMHIPLLAHYAWDKLRIPYVIAMPLLFASEMAAVGWLVFAPEQRALVLWPYGALLLLVTLLSLLAALLADEKRKRLLEGPDNVEGFLPAHIIFILITFLMPAILQAIALAHASKH